MYEIINETTIKRLSDDAFIPAVEGNADYQAYLEWVAGGGQAVMPSPPPPPPIPDLSPRQLWLGLMTEEIITPEEAEAASLGTIPAFIEAVIADFPSPVQRAAARVTINKGLTIERNNALVTDALARLPVPPPPEAVDAFFLTYSQV